MFHHEQRRRAEQTGRTFGHEFRSAFRLIIFLILLFLASYAFGQPDAACIGTDTTSTPGVLSPSNVGRRPVPYPYVREADIMWSKRIWRTLDLREKLNHPLYYPEAPHNGLESLFDLIKCGLLSGSITAFDNPALDDEFRVKMSAEEVSRLLISKEATDVEDPNNPGTYYRDTIVTEISSPDISAWWMKEDWFFDKQRSVMEVRIVGLCPLATKTDPQTGDPIGYKPLFWIYFPQLRPLLAKQGVYLGQNFSSRISYDDLFQKRYFASYIYKESNVYDRTVSSYESGIDAMLEAERIKTDIMDMESDLWHY